ncbi:MAG TPA: NUDIX domain-containing protein [Phototrophicaceae bacterium]|jgi:8-oxo-dGTP pyrophosphatase MutT (NUDIX family)|nr:NUDIX domain-containing protein [Phototrophicaceae bacterium]
MKMIDKLAWLHIVDRKILITRSRGKTTYYLPGGKREAGETDQVALIREIEEELSVTLNPESLQHMGTFEAQAHGQSEGVVVRMTCYSGDDYQGTLTPASEIEEMTWFTYQDKAKTSAVDHLIFDWLLEQKLID